jgi:hypothetical protein
LIGGSGIVGANGMTGFEGDEATLVPMALVAVTVNA